MNQRDIRPQNRDSQISLDGFRKTVPSIVFTGLQGDFREVSAGWDAVTRSVGCEAKVVRDKSLPEGFPSHIWQREKMGLYSSLVGQEIS